MRGQYAILLLVSLGACTKYQPIDWNGQGSWAEARAAAARTVASPRARMPDDLQRFLAGSSERPIAGPTTKGSNEGRHLVLPGESLSALALRYGVPIATLAKANNIKPPFPVYAGQVLAIPPSARGTLQKPGAAPVFVARPVEMVIAASEATPPAPAQGEAVATTAAAAVSAPAALAAAQPVTEVALTAPPPMTSEEVEAMRRAALKAPPSLSGDGFLWPVRGTIASSFGEKPNGARNDGVNIRAPEGTPVLAAENGVVVYAGDEIPAYGNMLLISHANGFTTAYAHNRDLLVRVGDVVSRGERIATVGVSGGLGSPQLHFELREGKKPIDPVAHLDSARTRVASTR